MSSGGHMADMVNRFNNNLKLKLEQHIKYEKVKEAYRKVNARYPDFIDRKKLSGEELEQLKKKIRIELIKDDKRIIALTIFISLIIISIILIYLNIRFNLF
jgi:hypothetical protein